MIALETCSRRENLRFMNIPEESYENCIDIIYDIIEKELNINTDNMQFQAVHRIGKARSASSDDTRASPRPIIVRFLLREDRDKVLNAKNKLKNSKVTRTSILRRTTQEQFRWNENLSSKRCSKPGKEV